MIFFSFSGTQTFQFHIFVSLRHERNLMIKNPLLYQIALSMMEGVGPKLARQAVAYVGSVEGVFTESDKMLSKIPGFGPATVKKINRKEALFQAEEELKFVEKHKLNVRFYLDDEYPTRLKECVDAPLLLYQKGQCNFNTSQVISIVGTRNASNYGRALTEKFVADFAARYPTGIVVSGLAYGIDVCAHKAALANGLNTVAVMGTGMDVVYPSLHRNTAIQILERGALLTEFKSKSKPDRQNFVKRNRIVAGISDAVVVIETGIKGGSLITANLALSYNRDVFAYPGNVGLEFSEGCNNLIKTNRAGLIESFADLELQMGWEPTSTKAPSKKINAQLTEDEQLIAKAIELNPEADISLLARILQVELSTLASILFDMELKGVIRKLPGNVFAMN